MSIALCVVLYRRAPMEAETIRSILRGADDLSSVTLYIRDNSPTPQETPEDVAKLSAAFGHYIYSWDGENRSLSAVYNEAALRVSTDLFVVLDDDTSLPDDFLAETVRSAAGNPDIDLFLPVVISDERIVSPGGYRFVKGYHWKTERRGRLPARNLVAIASGMAIRRNYLREYNPAFDEGLAFYGIDTRFLLDHARHRAEVFVTECTLQHDSALETEKDAERLLHRFRKLRHAWARLHRRDPVRHVASLGYAALVSIRMAFRYRDPRFLR